MKIAHLLQEDKELSYDGDLKRVMGDTRAWLEKSGIGPHDVKQAMIRIKELPEFERIIAGVDYISTARQEANGSLVFAPKAGSLSRAEYAHIAWVAHVSAMGQIRFASPAGWRRGMQEFHRLASPKPGLVHGNPVASLVKTMKHALHALAKKPKMFKALRDAEQAERAAGKGKEKDGKMVKEELVPKSEGWYIVQANPVAKTRKYLAGPMQEAQADKEVARRGGADKYISKSFISRMAIDKAAASVD